MILLCQLWKFGVISKQYPLQLMNFVILFTCLLTSPAMWREIRFWSLVNWYRFVLFGAHCFSRLRNVKLYGLLFLSISIVFSFIGANLWDSASLQFSGGVAIYNKETQCDDIKLMISDEIVMSVMFIIFGLDNNLIPGAWSSPTGQQQWVKDQLSIITKPDGDKHDWIQILHLQWTVLRTSLHSIWFKMLTFYCIIWSWFRFLLG